LSPSSSHLIMKEFDAEVAIVSDYEEKGKLEKIINQYGHRGFHLVSTLLGKNIDGANAVYLFFERNWRFG
jgi:hypothetical protein